jgi:polyisoprenyl-teichoic acid--peptidoglycan teichoic acid transferase
VTDDPVHTPSPRRGFRPSRNFLVALSLILIVTAGALGYIHRHGGLRNSLAALDLASPDLTDVFGKQKLRVLVLGVDDNWTADDVMYTTASRSDTMMAIEIDLASKNVSVVSIPRDLWVHIPRSGFGKINEAIADGGPERSEKTVVDDLGFPAFDNYMVLKMDATKNIVDAIGGLDVDVEKDIDYDDNWGHFHVHLKKGLQHLNGDGVVGYIRFRHDPEGDFGRMRRQQQVIRILVHRFKDPSIIARLPSLIGIVQDNVRTDLTYDKLFYLAVGLRDLTPSMVHATQLPATIGWTDDQSVLYYDADLGRPIVERYMVAGFNGQFDPSVVHVSVHNGSGQPGAAAALAQYLRQRGFTVVDTGNAASFGATRTTVTALDQKVAGEVAKQLPMQDALVAVGPVQGADVDITIGRDYQAQ